MGFGEKKGLKFRGGRKKKKKMVRIEDGWWGCNGEEGGVEGVVDGKDGMGCE
jgi:hypothetical protein